MKNLFAAALLEVGPRRWSLRRYQHASTVMLVHGHRCSRRHRYFPADPAFQALGPQSSVLHPL